MDLLKFNSGEVVLALVSGVAMCAFIAAFFHTSIANVSFIYGTSPIVTVMLAWMLLRDRPASATMIAAMASAAGVGILTWGGQRFEDFLGLGLAGVMTLLMSAIAVLVKYFPEADAGKATYLSALVAALLMAPFVETYLLDIPNLVWLALYGIVNVGLGFGIYLLGVAHVRPSTAALIGILEVPLAPVWAAILFDETLTAAALLGGSLITVAALAHLLNNRVAR